MSAVAESWYVPVRPQSVSSRSSGAARNIERLADQSLIKLKTFRADFLECLNDVEDLRRSDAAAIKGDSYGTARRFLLALPSTVIAPEVTMDVDGEFVFDWFNDSGGTVSVCARHDGKLAYAARFGARVMHGHAVMDRAVPQEIVGAITSLRGDD